MSIVYNEVYNEPFERFFLHSEMTLQDVCKLNIFSDNKGIHPRGECSFRISWALWWPLL